MKRILILLLCVILSISLASCKKKRDNGYVAEGLTENTGESSLTISFDSLDGEYDYTLKYSDGYESAFSYRSTLKSGNIKVYRELADGRELIFENEGYPIEGSQDIVDPESEIRIVIIAENAKGGNVEIRLGK